jgi:phage tail-like protein
MALGARSLGSLVAGEFNLRGDSSKFLVVFDDGTYDLGSWSRVGGLGVTWDVVEHRTGDTNQVWTMPGIAKYDKITLSRATCPDSQLVQEWLAQTSQKPMVYSGSIKLLSWAGIPLCEWTLKSFVPIAWKIADLETKSATVVTETLTLAHTGFLADDLILTSSGGGMR